MSQLAHVTHFPTAPTALPFHQLLYEAYVVEQGWGFHGTQSGIHVQDQHLLDDFFDLEQIRGLSIGGELVMGFRILEQAVEMRRYPHSIPPHFLSSCIEANRIVVRDGFRGLQLSQFVGRECFRYCRENGFRYVVFGGNQAEMNKRLRRTPGVTVLEGALTYPEGPVDVSICDTHHPLLRLFYRDAVFNTLVGRQLSRRLVKRVTAVGASQKISAGGIAARPV